MEVQLSAPRPGNLGEPCLRGLRILVVDDEPNFREGLALVLIQHGGVVRTATTTEEALREFAREVPDVLVSDIAMPMSDGHALIRAVRALGPDDGGNVPAMALTGHARRASRGPAIDSGFNTEISKLTDPLTLVRAIDELSRISYKKSFRRPKA